MTEPDKPNEGELILYQPQEGTVRIEVLYESETFWLNQKRIADLFGVELPTISYHLKEIYDSGELSREATLRKIPKSSKGGEPRGRPRDRVLQPGCHYFGGVVTMDLDYAEKQKDKNKDD